MLELEPGRGVTYFRGNQLHRIAHPAREVGVSSGTYRVTPRGPPGGSSVCSVPRPGCLRPCRTRCSKPSASPVSARSTSAPSPWAWTAGWGLPPRSWAPLRRLSSTNRPKASLHASTAGCTDSCGTTLTTAARCSAPPRIPRAARLADHVVTIDAGRLVADQDAAEFSRTRLRPRVAVRTPHAARLAAVVHREARAARRSVEVVAESSNRLSVYGSSCAEIGETAFRHGVLVHRLTDEVGDTGPEPAHPAGTGRRPAARCRHSEWPMRLRGHGHPARSGRPGRPERATPQPDRRPPGTRLRPRA